MNRDDAWREVWTERDPDRADWNGYEDCFSSRDEYEAWVSSVGEFVVTELRLGPDDTVADLGCGTGRMVELLAPRVASIRGLDFSRAALELARVRTEELENVTLVEVDLNAAPPDLLAGVTKAYAVAALYYLSSVDYVLDLLAGFHHAGVEMLLLDLPDADRGTGRDRAYDRELYSHLYFRTSDFTDRFPGARVIRDRFPYYANDAVRFSVHLPV